MERKHEGRAHIHWNPVSASQLEMRDPFPACSRKNSRRFRRISRGGALHRKGERNCRVVPPFRESPRCVSPFQRNPKIHVSTGEESSGSDPDSTQGLRPGHRRERNPDRPPRNSQGDWPFLRPQERVPEGPVVSREHLPQLEKIQEVLPSRRDEAHFR